MLRKRNGDDAGDSALLTDVDRKRGIKAHTQPVSCRV